MLVCDTTVNGTILGTAENYEDALEILRDWAGPLHVTVHGAVVRNCLLADEHPQHGRTVTAWVVATQPADVLAAVCQQIWGSEWQTALSRAIMVNDRTVRRWLSGSSPVPDGVFDDLKQWLNNESERLQNIATLID